MTSYILGLRSIGLEGFSEDVDMDGFVDPLIDLSSNNIAARTILNSGYQRYIDNIHDLRRYLQILNDTLSFKVDGWSKWKCNYITKQHTGFKLDENTLS